MSNGWVKLYRKIDNNEFLMKDNTARLLFLDLLRVVDKTSGTFSGGRFQLSSLCNLKPVTLYKALKRLEKAEMVTLVSNNRFTTIYICKWATYQAPSNTLGNNAVTTKEQQREHSNKNIATENKEGESFQTFFKPQKKKSKNLLAQAKDICQLFTEHTGGSFLNTIHLEAIVGLLESHGVDKVNQVAEFALSLKPKEYQVRIAKPVDLADHWPKIIELMEAPPMKESLLDKLAKQRGVA